MKRNSICGLFIPCLALLAACSSSPSQGPAPEGDGTEISRGVTSAALEDESDADLEELSTPRTIMRAVFDEAIRHRPVNAIFAGVRTYDALLDDLSEEEYCRHFRRMNKLAAKLATIDATKLSSGEQIALDIAKTRVRDARSAEKAVSYRWEVSPFDTVGNNWAYLASSTELRSRADVDAMIARYGQIPRAIGQHIRNLRTGLASGLTASRPVIERTISGYRTYQGLPAAEGSPFAALRFAANVSDADKQAWTAEVRKVVDDKVRPAMIRYADFLQNTVVPSARTTYGVGGLGAIGQAYYPDQIEVHVGRRFTPDEVHALGLQRVAELEPLMRRDLAALGIDEPTLAAGLAKLRELPESKPASVDEARAHAYEFLPRIYAKAWAEDTWGVPNPPPMQVQVLVGDRSAYYVIGSNTMTLSALSKPLYQFDGTVLHEAMHYLQDLVIRSATGEEPVSPYVATSGGSALSEGSAHYAEVLALDTTIYETGNPRLTALTRLSALGQLMLRAVRLVVDSGIHAKGWTREQTLAYMAERLDMSAGSIAFEADRYASWPGQAITYRLGAETIASEQARARAAMGERFSQSAYNRMVLGLFGGSVDLLKQKTDAFIAQ
ncbi:DUF885 domain-containing protein [Pendulispora albinea]|uniref:DUF885 domain-containing protein n=1 Tax=Pendulispora albinea TaxID=2741071 RepID=A0ABZ2M489_9BACT